MCPKHQTLPLSTRIKKRGKISLSRLKFLRTEREAYISAVIAGHIQVVVSFFGK
jgi:hypothetical protein